MNLTFTRHEQDADAEDEEEEKGEINNEDSDSSMASIFGDDNEEQPEVGTKRTYTQASTGANNESGEKKRRKLN